MIVKDLLAGRQKCHVEEMVAENLNFKFQTRVSPKN